MANNVVFFMVPADDTTRARRFYERVFGWRFEPSGPPDFYRIETGDAQRTGIWGALTRRPAPYASRGLGGFVCTVSVDSAERTQEAIARAGGAVVQEDSGEIIGVGKLLTFRDTEGNVVQAIEYEPRMLAELRKRSV